MRKLVFYLAVFILTVASGAAYKQLVSKACLRCLCETRTGCNLERGCQGDTCGMYALTRGFWLDAGTPKVTSHSNAPISSPFQACASDEECATTAIQNYMRVYDRDCNRDGVIDCTDYAAIHIHGPNGCYEHHNSHFVQAVVECLKGPSDSTISPVEWRMNAV